MAPRGSTISPWRSGPAKSSALAGVEGNGQSELGMVLAGLLRPTEGRFYIGDVDLSHAGARGGDGRRRRHRARGPPRRWPASPPCRLPRICSSNKLDQFTRLGLLNRRALNEKTRKLMQAFDVRAAGPEVAFSGLSGGNQQKAVLARELTLEPLVVLVAAQPTRGLDVSAVEAVYRQIRAAARRGVGVLLISSELDELIAVADRIAVLYRGRLVGERPADMSERAAIGALMSGQVA